MLMLCTIVSIPTKDKISDYEDSVAVGETPSSYRKRFSRVLVVDLKLEVVVVIVVVVVVVATWSAVASTHS